MNIEEIELSKLKYYPVEVRIHTESQMREYKKAIEMFGQTRPMVVDKDNVVLAGNGLLRALNELGWKKGFVVRYNKLSEAEKKKLILSDNAIASLGKDNNENIVSLISSIEDLNIPGFDTDVLRAIASQPIDLNQDVMEYGSVGQGQEEVMQAFDKGKEDLLNRVSGEREKYEGEMDRSKAICPNCGTVIV